MVEEEALQSEKKIYIRSGRGGGMRPKRELRKIEVVEAEEIVGRIEEGVVMEVKKKLRPLRSI